MTNTGDDGDAACGDCAGEFFIIESREIVGAAAAAQDGDHFNVGMLVEIFERTDDLFRSAQTLDLCVDGFDFETTPTVVEYFQEIEIAGGIRRRNNTDFR